MLQLDHYHEISMETEGRHVLINQASNRDYDSSTDYFDRGHLAPVSHANSQGCVYASFTLTNAAPQYFSFNRGQWKMVESRMVRTVTWKCRDNSAYIVTGVVSGEIYMNNRVNVPKCFWTAYCCQTDKGLTSGAVIGINSVNNLPSYPLPVDQLERVLALHYRAWAFSLFDNNCRNNYVPVIDYNYNTLQRILDSQKECLVASRGVFHHSTMRRWVN